eukprot:4309488-Amphidinium_carterae.1
MRGTICSQFDRDIKGVLVGKSELTADWPGVQGEAEISDAIDSAEFILRAYNHVKANTMRSICAQMIQNFFFVDMETINSKPDASVAQAHTAP